MHVVTSINTIFSQKKKRQSAIKIFWREQFPLAWEAKVKKNPKNLIHLNKSNYLAGPNSLSQHTLKLISFSLPLPVSPSPSPSHSLFFPPASPSLPLIAPSLPLTATLSLSLLLRDPFFRCKW